jgi:hypothetical protein
MVAGRVEVARPGLQRVLRGEHELFAAALQQLAEELLRAAIGVDVRGVEKVAVERRNWSVPPVKRVSQPTVTSSTTSRSITT